MIAPATSPFRKTARQREAVRLLSGPARHILLDGGSRSGKTAIAAYAVVVRALKAPGTRHLFVRFRFNHAKTSLWHDTLPKVIGAVVPGMAVEFNSSDFFIRFPNGSEIWIAGLDEKARVDKILGTEYSTIVFEEASQIPFDSVTTARTRLSQRSPLTLKCIYTQNPPSKRHWTYLLFYRKVDPESMAKLKMPDDYAVMSMHPKDNLENLGDGYLRELEGMPERKRRRFLDGRYGEDTEGALWTSEMIAATRVLKHPFDLRRVVVGVDPAVSSKATSAETGIVTVGVHPNGNLYCWRDDTLRATPLQWAQRVSLTYEEEEADLVVGEVNNGGDLVESNIRQVNRHISYRAVRATRGKEIRAEPIANLMEQGKFHIVGEMPDLEDELTTWTPQGDEPSPNRLDAMVWAVTELVGAGAGRVGTFGRSKRHAKVS